MVHPHTLTTKTIHYSILSLPGITRIAKKINNNNIKRYREISFFFVIDYTNSSTATYGNHAFSNHKLHVSITQHSRNQ